MDKWTFPEKIADVVHNEYQGSDGVTDNEDFDESEFGWGGASDDCALNKGFQKCVWLKSEAFLNLIKDFQMLNNYNTVISFFPTNIPETYLIFCNPKRVFSSLFLIGSFLNVLATE